MFFIILLLCTFAYFATDVYLPALPELCNYFDVSENVMQNSISLFILGLSLSQVVYGLISDRYGRKPSLYIGLFISLFGTCLTVYSNDSTTFIVGRLIQGLGLGSCVTVPRSILPDMFKAKDLAIYGSHLAMAVPIVLSLAPIVGGYIQYFSSWRGIFVFVSIYTVILLILVRYFLPETNKHKDNSATNINKVILNMRGIFSSKEYLYGAVCCTAVMFSIMYYITVSAFIIQDYAGASYIEYSWFMGSNGIIIMLGSTCNKHALKSISIGSALKLGGYFSTACGILILVVNAISYINPYLIVVPCWLLFMSLGFTGSNSLAMALKQISRNSFGLAVACISSIQMFGGFLAGFIASLVPKDNLLSLGIAVLFGSIMSCFAANRIVQMEKLDNESK